MTALSDKSPERRVVFAAFSAVAAALILLGVLPHAWLVAAAQSLSKDGELAPASLRALRALSLAAGPAGVIVLAGILFAVFPSQIGCANLLCTEISFTALALGFIAALPRVAARTSFARSFALHAPVGIGAAILALPWGLRNKSELGAFVPFSTNAGVNFHFANNSHTNGTGLDIINTTHNETRHIADEVARNREGLRLGIQWCREHPARVPPLMFRKIVMLNITDGVWTHWSFAGTTGAMRSSVRPAVGVLSTTAWYALLFIAAIWLGQERYHFPYVPALCILAATLIVRTSPSPSSTAASNGTHAERPSRPA